MNKLNIDEIKKIQLNILDQVDGICQDNNLQYYLSSGTLLGAVRHNGFIPWDDDIDLFMPRDDYEKLYELAANLPKNLSILKPTDKNSLYTYIKIYNNQTVLKEFIDRQNDIYNEYGVYIDIFPLDGLPEGITNVKKHLQKTSKLITRHVKLKSYALYSKIKFSKNIKTNAKIIIGYFIDKFYKNGYYTKLDKLVRKYSLQESEYVGPAVTRFPRLLAFNKEIFGPGKAVSFEGKYYSGPCDSHKYLQVSYGEYMKLPKEEDRVSGHDYDVYVKSE